MRLCSYNGRTISAFMMMMMMMKNIQKKRQGCKTNLEEAEACNTDPQLPKMTRSVHGIVSRV